MDPVEDVSDGAGHAILELLQKENAEKMAGAVDFHVATKLLAAPLQAVPQLGLLSRITAIDGEEADHMQGVGRGDDAVGKALHR